MEPVARDILFIDDHSQEYLSTLKPAAHEAGFQLIAINTVAEGLNFLNNYAVTIEAVILDLTFPKNEVQGMEALEKIKSKYPNLPVIMLTDSDTSSDIEQVVACMKKGAYNYVGKKTLNPAYLFQVVENAVQQARVQLRFGDYTEKKDQRFYTIIDTCNIGRFEQNGVFGFELLSVNKPAGEHEANRLAASVKQWHENLLKSISNFCHDELQLNLKYLTEENKIKCRLIFTVYAIDKKRLGQILNILENDISALFSSSKIDSTHPYLFGEINDREYLKGVNKYSNAYSYEEFYRNPIEIESGNSIGFGASAKPNSSKTSESNIHKLPPLPKEFSFDNELLRALLNHNDDAEINILLNPRRPNKYEIDVIREVVNDYSLLDNQNFNEEELDLYNNYLQTFIESNSDKFVIRVILKHSKSSLSQHLKTGILNYSFGQQSNAEYRPCSIGELSTTNIGKNEVANQLPYMYSINDSIQAFRLPVPGFSSLPGIQQQSHNFYTVPENLPDDGISLGVKKTGQSEQEVKISQNGLAKHLYVTGQTGTGKSTLLKTMVANCLDKNKGFTVLDPHGDLFEEVRNLIPADKQDKLVVIDTTKPEKSAKFNPLSFDKNQPEKKSLVINELIRVVGSLYDLTRVGGPMFELYMKNGLLLVLDEGVQDIFETAPELEDFNKVFYKERYRKKLLTKCQNTKLIDFFGTAGKAQGDMSFANFTPYITSKLTRLTDDQYIAPIISSSQDNLNFRTLIDEKKILLVKMDKGLIGADNVSLMGQLIISRLVMAAMSRGNISKENRTPFYLFIDEFQNFIKGDVGSALSEVRKYGLSLILANQTMGQLDNQTVEAIMGNVGSKCFFRPGINDYEKIKHYVEPEFKRKDVLKLPNFNCISRLMIDNVPTDPFVFQTKVTH